MAKVGKSHKDRITARLNGPMKQAIEEAAGIVGASVNQFVAQAAFEKAEEIIVKSRTIMFSEDEAQKLLEIISNPAKPNASLLDAVKARRDLLGRR